MCVCVWQAVYFRKEDEKLLRQLLKKVGAIGALRHDEGWAWATAGGRCEHGYCLDGTLVTERCVHVCGGMGACAEIRVGVS